jgi:peptidoglycan hydrolase CwlO-like protein
MAEAVVISGDEARSGKRARARSLTFGVLFWLLSLTALAMIVYAVFSVSQLQANLKKAQSDLADAQAKTAALNHDLLQSKGEIEKLCTKSTEVNAALLKTKEEMREALGSDFLAKARLVQSLACTLDKPN